jgi:cold-inducible RNA-binding protein
LEFSPLSWYKTTLGKKILVLPFCFSWANKVGSTGKLRYRAHYSEYISHHGGSFYRIYGYKEPYRREKMGKRLYVGNLPYGMTNQELADAFTIAGPVTEATIVIDRETGRSRGFGFVEMTNEADAAAALTQMNGAGVGGRMLKVAEAKDRPARTSGGSGGYGGDRDGDRPRSGGTRRNSGY